MRWTSFSLGPTSMATIDADQRLEIYIFGGTIGESTVVRLPSGRWGVIDCYSPSIRDRNRNPVRTFLAARNVSVIEFLCLTHPHHDHFRGMSHLLDDLDVKYFWRPAAMEGQRLGWIIKSYQQSRKIQYEATRAAALADADVGPLTDSAELMSIFQIVDRKRKLRNEPGIRFANINTRLYPGPIDGEGDVLVEAVAPSGEQVERYEQALRSAFDQNGRFNSRSHQHHNLASIALRIRFGRTQVIIGGDVQEEGWSDALEQCRGDQLEATLVKVSHHGSENGYCDGLWEQHSAGGRPISVICPYARFHLPAPTAVSHIRRFSSSVITPCLSALRPPPELVPMSIHASPESRRALSRTFRARRAADFSGDWCGFVFDSEGRVCETRHGIASGEIES